ncbi:osmotically inducible protein C [Seonamhaeicola sp. S2-3]|uniref:OsmC family protein n=1 Tax=Seonamhaeicola sp. S2-3 TaxID=1936081 RepID=UPI000972BD2B|nr:OsmC family protein [Seonamhaeicola sp. S2-3]APY11352.1 osmotically inducible protein C [Seonamhaeicola sp. S2-3]
MDYTVKATSFPQEDAEIDIKTSKIAFGTTTKTADVLPNPAELFLGSFAACVLKNVARFAEMMKFQYQKAQIDVKATRLDKPPRMEHINYVLTIYSNDEKLNVRLLKKNIERFGTIYNTVKLACSISGSIKIIKHV